MSVPREIDCIDVRDFKPGRSITVTFRYPKSDRAYINLKDSKGGVVLHIDTRVTFGAQPGQPRTNTLVLNNMPSGGSWGKEQVVSDFYFTEGTLITMTAIATDNSRFQIVANGKNVATYVCNASLPLTSVQRVSFTSPTNSPPCNVCVDYEQKSER